MLVLAAALAAVAVLAFSPSLRKRLLTKAPKPVPFRVNSTPEGARVFIDDEPVGTTPVSVELPPGPRRVRVVRRGFQPWHEAVDPAATPQVSPSLAPLALASLVVESEPDKAEVFLDAERCGTTPLELHGIEAGTHTLRITKAPLYRPVVKAVELKAGQSLRVAVTLESGLESLYEERIRAEPAKLSNYTELMNVHILSSEPEKAAATLAQAVGAVDVAELAPTDLGQFYGETRKLLGGQAGALEPASRAKLLVALATLLEKLMLQATAEYTRYAPLVAILVQAGQFEEVYKLCEKASDAQKGRGLPHYYAAVICSGQGETVHAIRLLERSLALQPALLSARFSLASAYLRTERPDDALKQYLEAEKTVPAASAYYQGTIQAGIAKVLIAKKDVAGAIERYKKAIAIAAPPSYNAQWRLQFAELLLDQGRKNEAVEQYQEIVKIASADTEAGLAARRALRRLTDK